MGIDDFDALDYIDVVGDVTTFAGAMQLNIKRVRKAQEGEYDPADYLPVSENSTDDMYGQLLAMIKSVKNEYLSALLNKLFVEDKEFLKSFQALQRSVLFSSGSFWLFVITNIRNVAKANRRFLRCRCSPFRIGSRSSFSWQF